MNLKSGMLSIVDKPSMGDCRLIVITPLETSTRVDVASTLLLGKKERRGELRTKKKNVIMMEKFFIS